MRDYDNLQLTPDVYREPLPSRLKSALYDLCDIKDDTSPMYTGLNYVEKIGIVSQDEAACILPILTVAYSQYFATIDPSIQFTQPSEIISVQYMLLNGLVVSRIYYQIYANTTQPFNAFNYQIRNTHFGRNLILSTRSRAYNLSNIVSRGMTVKKIGRTDLITRVRKSNSNLILSWLPFFSVECPSLYNDIVLEKKQSIENVLINFWHTC